MMVWHILAPTVHLNSFRRILDGLTIIRTLKNIVKPVRSVKSSIIERPKFHISKSQSKEYLRKFWHRIPWRYSSLLTTC